MHVKPSPKNPGPHAQVREPPVFVQIAAPSQPPLPTAHSSMSVQPVAPSPVYPLGHAPHVREPPVLLHVVSASQPRSPPRHASTPGQPAAPSPAYALGQAPPVA